MTQSLFASRVARAFAVTAFALGSMVAACSSGSQGAEGEACYPNNTCNEGFVCKAGTCVRSGGGSGGDTSSGTGGTGTGSSTTTTGTGGSTTTGSTSSSSGTGGAPANKPPVILAFGTNVTSITAGEQVTFTAIVTDPDGIDDVIGGTLLEQGGAIYGAFATTAQEGSYQISLSWDQIDQVMAIAFAQGANATRTFKAQFFDQGGHTVEKNVDLALTCNGKAACAGACVDLMADKLNCGSCGHQCTGGSCSQGKCPALSACLPKSNLTTCQSYCASQGQTCAGSCNNPYAAGQVGGITFGNTTCTQYSGTATCSASISTAQSSRCCCAQ